jgi:hypothetical protein
VGGGGGVFVVAVSYPYLRKVGLITKQNTVVPSYPQYLPRLRKTTVNTERCTVYNVIFV